MKQEIPKGVIVAVVAVLVLGIGLALWKKSTEPSVERDAQGNLVTGIDPKKVKSPAEIKAEMDKMVQQEKEAKGAH